MKKLLAAVAVLAPVMSIVPAAPASADSVCAPVTIDGQPVCQDLTPVEQAIADAEATALQLTADAEALAIGTVNQVFGPELIAEDTQQHCIANDDGTGSYLIAIDVVVVDTTKFRECDGYGITVSSVGTTPGPVQHVHVPQVCLTPTGTCVGPVDQDVQLPAEPTPVSVCLHPERVYLHYDGQSYGYHREDTSAPTCISVP